MEGTGRSRGRRTQKGGGTRQMVGHGSSMKDSRLQTEQREEQQTKNKQENDAWDMAGGQEHLTLDYYIHLKTRATSRKL